MTTFAPLSQFGRCMGCGAFFRLRDMHKHLACYDRGRW